MDYDCLRPERTGPSSSSSTNNLVEEISVRKRIQNRVPKENFELRRSNVLSANYESLDYDDCENFLYLEEERQKGYRFVVKKDLSRWLVFILIGIFTACVGCYVDISIDLLSSIKYSQLKRLLDRSIAKRDMISPTLAWIVFNVIPVLIGSLLVTYVEPIALGSGIPQVKCYLNGIKMPRIVRLKTLLVKSIGVVTTVVGGLAGGKEGPMIHSGAVVAAGISQGKSTSLNKDFGIFKYFRNDHEKRDFVSGGAAAGVAAAFGAPVGGVLFSLEEGASFWNQSLTWRIFLSSMISAFTLNLILSTYHGYPGQLKNPGLLNFGQFKDLSYEFYEFVIFIAIGAAGGLLGALFNWLNYELTVFRTKYMRNALYLRVLEAVIVAFLSALIPILMIYTIDDCHPLQTDAKRSVQMYCSDGEAASPAALWLQVPEASVRSFFHDDEGIIGVTTISVFAFVYYFLSMWTYGLSVSGGIFIPQLLTGAAWGRLIGVCLKNYFPDIPWGHPGKYALAGAAAQLGGVVRMTISLTVILIEATGNISFGLPLMLILITAKWVADFFNEGIYDLHIGLAGVPLLGWEPPPLSSNVNGNKVMAYPVTTFKVIENVGRIIDVLQNTTHNGFPVVDPQIELGQESDSVEPRSVGCLKGLILRHQLIILLKNRIFNESSAVSDSDDFSLNTFRKQYPRYPSIQEVHIDEHERSFTVDLRMFMNPSPYVIQYTTSLPRIFRLFRALGLRHLIVINECNEVIGIITRKDLARYKVTKHYGKIHVEEMRISDHL